MIRCRSRNEVRNKNNVAKKLKQINKLNKLSKDIMKKVNYKCWKIQDIF